VPAKPRQKRRSGCPVNLSLEILGDRWSLLVIRDLMVRGYKTFKEFQNSGEKIATNILSERLVSLEADGILTRTPDPADRRRLIYRLTEKGIALAPVVLELLIWGARHNHTGAPIPVIDHMAANRDWVLQEVHRRWAEHDPTPFLPPFPSKKKATET
jgi:DNA-binding HxlR family transcriptional regulator